MDYSFESLIEPSVVFWISFNPNLHVELVLNLKLCVRMCVYMLRKQGSGDRLY